MTHSLKTIGMATMSALMASGCVMLGPDYQEPSAPFESKWMEANDPLVSSEAPADPKWWQTAFHDPVLDQLVETALQENLTLRSAALRVLQSQQQLAIAIGKQYPQQQQVTGLAGRERSTGVTFNEYSLGFNLSWEVDFWGASDDRWSRRQRNSMPVSLTMMAHWCRCCRRWRRTIFLSGPFRPSWWSPDTTSSCRGESAHCQGQIQCRRSQ